jgi:hypothetical protein
MAIIVHRGQTSAVLITAFLPSVQNAGSEEEEGRYEKKNGASETKSSE